MIGDQLAFDIDLDISPEFGHWFAGLVDGEGHLYCGFSTCGYDRATRKRFPACQLIINLRADDIELLQMVQETLNVGTLCKKPRRGISFPQVVYTVSRLADLRYVVIPLLDRYGLRSKKLRDYMYWRECIRLTALYRENRSEYVVWLLEGLTRELRISRQYRCAEDNVLPLRDLMRVDFMDVSEPTLVPELHDPVTATEICYPDLDILQDMLVSSHDNFLARQVALARDPSFDRHRGFRLMTREGSVAS